MSDEVLRFLLKGVKSGDLEVEDAVKLVRTAAQNEPVVIKPYDYLQPWTPPTWSPNTTFT